MSNNKRGKLILDIFIKYIGVESPEEPGQLFDFLIRNTNRVMKSCWQARLQVQ